MVRDAICRLEHQTKAMEIFGSLPDAPKDECLRLVRSSDVFIGIVGVRYGSLDSASGKSMSELEYDEASAVQIPCLIYLIDDETHAVLPKHVEVGEGAVKLSNFKDKLRSRHVVSTYSSVPDLVAKVTQDLVRLLGARQNAPNAEVLAQIARNAIMRHPLTEPRFKYLREKMAGTFKSDLPDSVLREALELALAGDNMAAAFVLSRGGSIPLDDAVDGLMKFEKVIAEIVVSGREKLAPTEGVADA
jgi:hypothetical protein